MVHGIAGSPRLPVAARRYREPCRMWWSRVRAPPGPPVDTLDARASDADQAGGQLGAPCLRRRQLTLDRSVGLAVHPERLGVGRRSAADAPEVLVSGLRGRTGQLDLDHRLGVEGGEPGAAVREGDAA